MDNIEHNIDKITQLFGKEELPDNIKQIISSLLQSSKSNNSSDNTKNKIDNSTNDDNSFKDSSDEFLKILPKLKLIFEMTTQKPDNRINLLNSIKPFLNDSRKQRVDNSIKYLNTFIAISTLNEIDKSL